MMTSAQEYFKNFDFKCPWVFNYFRTGDREFKCDKCDYYPWKEIQLNAHMRTHHKNATVYSFDKYDYVGTTSVLLNQHLKVHTVPKLGCSKMSYILDVNYKRMTILNT